MIHQVKILERLALSEEQKRAVGKVLDKQRAALTRQVTDLAGQHRGLESAIGAGTSETALREKAAALGRLYGDVAVTRAGLMAEFNGILTDEQKHQAAKLQAEDEKQDQADGLAQEQALRERLEKAGGLSPLDKP
jgi:hypothetical protein